MKKPVPLLFKPFRYTTAGLVRRTISSRDTSPEAAGVATVSGGDEMLEASAECEVMLLMAEAVAMLEESRSEIVPVKMPAMGSRFTWKVDVLKRKYSPWLRPFRPTQFMGPSVMVISFVAYPARLMRTTMACCRRELRAVGGR